MKKLTLTKTQMIALQACASQVAEARAQLKAVQIEIGLDPLKNYRIDDSGMVMEVNSKGEVVDENKV